MQNLWDGIRNQLPTLRTVEPREENEEEEGFEVGDVEIDKGGSSTVHSPMPPIESRPALFSFRSVDVQMAELCSFVFFGSKNVASKRELLKSRGVTHIINATPGIANHFPEDFVYKRVEILDMPEMDIKSHFVPCIEFIDEAIVTGGAVYIHCNAGVSRSASICLAYLISSEQMNLDSALKHIRSIRACVRPNDGFIAQLRDFQRETMGSAP